MEILEGIKEIKETLPIEIVKLKGTITEWIGTLSLREASNEPSSLYLPTRPCQALYITKVV